MPSIRYSNGIRGWRPRRAERVDQLAHAVTKMWDRDCERYEELRQIFLDLGLVRDVTVKVYKDPSLR